MPYIYKITNKINGKVYIGKTMFSIQKRWQEHLKDSKKQRYEKRPLYNAINKYGEENFNVEQIEECEYNILNDRECFWIEYYGSFKNGYNATMGGDGKAYLDYELIYRTYLSVKNIKKTAELCNCSQDSVSYILEIHGINEEQRKINGHKSIMKPVAQIDIKTNEIIETFSSITEAEKKYPKAKRHITDVCKGKRKTAGGYKWKYL